MANDTKTSDRSAKDSVTRAPESGEKARDTSRRGTPTGAKKDDVRNAPESGDRTKSSK